MTSPLNPEVSPFSGEDLPPPQGWSGDAPVAVASSGTGRWWWPSPRWRRCGGLVACGAHGVRSGRRPVVRRVGGRHGVGRLPVAALGLVVVGRDPGCLRHRILVGADRCGRAGAGPGRRLRQHPMATAGRAGGCAGGDHRPAPALHRLSRPALAHRRSRPGAPVRLGLRAQRRGRATPDHPRAVGGRPAGHRGFRRGGGVRPAGPQLVVPGRVRQPGRVEPDPRRPAVPGRGATRSGGGRVRARRASARRLLDLAGSTGAGGGPAARRAGPGLLVGQPDRPHGVGGGRHRALPAAQGVRRTGQHPDRGEHAGAGGGHRRGVGVRPAHVAPRPLGLVVGAGGRPPGRLQPPGRRRATAGPTGQRGPGGRARACSARTAIATT